MIKISVSAADAVLTQTETLTAGMVNLPTVQFTFTSDWNGLGKTAVVRAGTVVEELLVTDNQITVPAECMVDAGVNLIIGVWGGSDSVELPTVWCACGEILEGTDPTEASNDVEATTSNVAQMLGYADAIEQTAAAMAQSIITNVAVNTTNVNRYGTVQVAVSDSGPGSTRTLTFTFANMKGNGIESITFTESGDYKGRIQVRLSDNTVTNFDALISCFQDMASIDAAEALRVAAEELRDAAEALRVTAEEGRVDAEATRVSNEEGRVAAEEARAAEWEEWSSETEMERRANEAQRIENEEERQANELVRQGNENDRESAEAARALAESGRVEAEAARVIAENQRQATYSSKEDVNNKVSAWEDVPDNDHYPSEKLVKDDLDTKVPTTRTVNSKALSSDVMLSAEDLQYDSTLVSHTAGSVGEELDEQSRRIDGLDGDDIAYDSSASYASGTIGNALKSQGSLTGEYDTTRKLTYLKDDMMAYVFGISEFTNDAGATYGVYSYSDGVVTCTGGTGTGYCTQFLTGNRKFVAGTWSSVFSALQPTDFHTIPSIGDDNYGIEITNFDLQGKTKVRAVLRKSNGDGTYSYQQSTEIGIGTKRLFIFKYGDFDITEFDGIAICAISQARPQNARIYLRPVYVGKYYYLNTWGFTNST